MCLPYVEANSISYVACVWVVVITSWIEGASWSFQWRTRTTLALSRIWMAIVLTSIGIDSVVSDKDKSARPGTNIIFIFRICVSNLDTAVQKFAMAGQDQRIWYNVPTPLQFLQHAAGGVLGESCNSVWS